MAADSKPYAAAWSSFRKRRRRFWLFYLGFVLYAVVLVPLLSQSVDPGALFLLVLVPWLAIGMPLAIQYKRFECPRCGQPFFVKGLFRTGYVRRCLYCNLPKWSEHSPGEPGI